MVLVIILMVLLGPPIGAFAQQCTNLYEVGGVGNLWAPVPSNPSYYREWASSITFRSGDCIRELYKNPKLSISCSLKKY